MIVQCPSCSSRYRVNDANIPPTGGKIRCPSCAHAFVVYPEAPASDEEDKTSIAERPNLQELLSSMQQGKQSGGNEAPGSDKTEVMSGAEMPDFSSLFGGGGNDPGGDRTVEMSNPLLGGGVQMPKPKSQGPAAGAFVEDEVATQEFNADHVQASIAHLREQAQGLDEDDEPRTEIAPPPMLSAPPAQQHRISASAEPTPPPASPANLGSGGFGQIPNTGPLNQGSAPAPGSFGSGPDAAPAAPAGGVDPNHDGPWKLQTNFGLTYEFADNKSLRNWLDSRDELDGYKLSADGTNFHPLADFPQVQKTPANQSGANRSMPSAGSGAFGTMAGMPAAPSGGGAQGMGSGPMGSGPMGGSQNPPPPRRTSSIPGSPFTTANPAVSGPGSAAAVPEQKEKINPNESFRPPARDSSAANLVLWGAFVLLFAAAAVLALHLADVITIPALERSGDEPEPTVQQAVVAEEGEAQERPVEEDPEEAAARARRDQEEVDRILSSAREDIDSNRLSSAMDRLSRARMIDSERIQIFDMKAEVHEKLGEMDKADEMRQQARRLRSAGGGAPVGN